MLSFLEYKNWNVLEEAVERNTHSTHLEDLCITNKKKGVAQALGGLLYVKKQFGTASSNKSTAVTIKVDGAPAILAGKIGIDNKFFVASKSLFNKEPKINFTDEDIDRNHSGGLAEKLHLALKYLKPIIPNGKIFQGDFLFDTSSRKSKTIDGKECYTWEPNTIEYSVEKDSPLGKKIGAAKFGIIFHTEYLINGEDIGSIRLKGFGVKEEDLKPSKDVWFIDAYHHDLGSITALSKHESQEFNQLEKLVKQYQSSINWNFDDTVTRNLLTFVNSYIRANKIQPDPKKKAEEFSQWISERSNAEIAKKKTEKGKASEAKKWESSIVYASDIKSLTNLFRIHDALTRMKQMMIEKLDSVKQINTFLVKSNGDLVVTGNEGFVLTRTSASGCKFVDRYTFSLANFSPEFKKGWDHA